MSKQTAGVPEGLSVPVPLVTPIMLLLLQSPHLKLFRETTFSRYRKVNNETCWREEE